MERLEGLAKLTGAERYVDDEPTDDILWGMTVRSPVSRGRVSSIEYGGDVDWSECTVVDHRDIPGENAVRLIQLDQPVLAADDVRHVHEAIALVAHPSREVVRRAVHGTRVHVERAEPALDFRVDPTDEQIQHGDDNLLADLLIDKGDVDAALRDAAHVVEGVYESGAQEHVYLETQGMSAWIDGDVVVVRGSMQCPYYVVNALMHALGRDESGVRAIQAPTGGGFGGKEDYPSNLAVHAALLALKSGRHVRMIYDRTEDMAATTKRHPALVRHRTGLDAGGRLVAQDIDVLLDGGAYVTLSPVVLSRGIIHAAGPYACDNVRIRGRARLTNCVPFGAFRGFGAPQTQFANERHMDVVARRVGIDPVELRRINLIRGGQTTSTGQRIDDGVDRVGVQTIALDRAEHAARRSAHRAHNELGGHTRRGTGFATFYHGAGFTGSGEVHLASRVRLAGLPDGRVEVLTAQTEMGQGTLTIFTQIIAERLGIAPSDVVVAIPDTARVPNSGPTVASRTAMVVGSLLERACAMLRERVGAADDVRAAIVAWHDVNDGELVCEVEYEPPPGIRWDDALYRGDAYAAFAWATYVADVEVDLRTGIVTVLDFVAAQEVGKVLNETLARGQIQGGVAQGIGWALSEACVWDDGAMKNNQLTNYVIPTSADLPSIRVVFTEPASRTAKGIGELPVDGAAPAELNAVADALGVEPCEIPLTPERVLELIDV